MLHPMKRVARLLLPALLAALTGSVPARAVDPQLLVTNDRELRFGAFAVFGSGYRIISPTGAVQGSGVFSTGSGDTGAARFTVAYDRGNNGRARLDLVIQLVFAPPPSVSIGGITARLSDYRSDLPQAPVIRPGQVVEIRLPDCRQRVCQTSFNMGGRIDVDRSFGGAAVAIPIPVDAVLVAVR